MLIIALRQTLRGLSRRPGFSLLAILTLAVGIGSTTAVYSIADAVLFRPLPFDETDRVVRLHSFNAARGFDFVNVSYPDFTEWRDETEVFDSAAAFRMRTLDLAGGDAPLRLRIGTVGADFFRVLRARPVVGRTFQIDDHDPANELVTVLSDNLWRGRFGGDTAIVGQRVRLDGVPHTVVGVVDETGQWPLDARAWVPVRFATPPTARSDHSWEVIARLAPDTSIGAATARISTLARRASAQQPEERDQRWDAAVTPLLSLTGDDIGSVFMLLFAAVLAVLLLACLNVANLLLTQGVQRAQHHTVRLALGAGRARVLGGVLGESLVLALVGGGLGIVLALATRDVLMALAPIELARVDGAGLRGPVVAMGLGLSVTASLVAGLLPAWHVSRADAGLVMRESAAHGGGVPARRTRHALVMLQVAVSLALLISSAVLVRALQRTLEIEPGFRTTQVLAFTLSLPEARYASGTSVNLFYDEAVTRLGAIPGVRSATATSVVPFGGGGFNVLRTFQPEGAPEPPAGPEYFAQWFEIDPAWFDTLDIRVASGRPFTPADGAEAPPTVLVNQTMAGRLAPGGTAVGMRIRSAGDEDEFRTVVGVLPNLAYTGLSLRSRPEVYVPRAQSTRQQMGVLVRGTGNPLDLLPAIRDRLSTLDADLALDGVVVLDQQMRTQLAGPRFITRLLSLFGLVSLLLAATGVYGLASFAAASRAHEIGIRMALGASHGAVRGLIIRQSAPVLMTGSALGIGGAFVVARVVASRFAGIPLFDLASVAPVTSLLLGAALLASYLPARRASGVDPLNALRQD